MVRPMYKLISVIMLLILLSACSKYEAETIPQGSTIDSGVIIPVRINSSVHLIPNQFSDITLQVPNILQRKVKDVEVKASVSIDSKSWRAVITPQSILFGQNQSLDINAEVLASDGELGIPLDCDQQDFGRCGALYLESGNEDWQLSLLQQLDLSNLSLLVNRG